MSQFKKEEEQFEKEIEAKEQGKDLATAGVDVVKDVASKTTASVKEAAATAP